MEIEDQCTDVAMEIFLHDGGFPSGPLSEKAQGNAMDGDQVAVVHRPWIPCGVATERQLEEEFALRKMTVGLTIDRRLND